MQLPDGSALELTSATVIAPLEKSLRLLSWSVVFLAAALAVARLG
jgi:hypothetical protein